MLAGLAGTLRHAGVVATAFAVIACGGDGGSDDDPPSPSPTNPAPTAPGGGSDDDPPSPTPPSPPPTAPGGDLTVSGTVTFDLVPATVSGLDYQNTVVAPARAVMVELISSANEILSSTVTDTDGRYALSAPADTEVFVRVRAEMVSTETPSWAFRVRDNTNGNALYVLEGAAFSTGSDDVTEDLHAASGWDGSRYADTRAAAPFAILDLAYEAASFVIGVDASIDFPVLDIFWSPDNVPELDANGNLNVSTGEIGGTFYWPGVGPGGAIYLLGAEDVDTEEYDRHVIAHEWGHYFENTFSRADSIGGPHSLRDQLDMRVAFGEGFGNALSAMALDDSLYKDVSGPRQSHAAGFDVEQDLLHPPSAPGWYSERSVQEILYDLFDANQDRIEDGLALGFEPLYDVLVTAQRESIALTSIFSFIDALKAALPADASNIDAIVGTQSIDDIVDAYGTGETNAGNPPSDDVLPIYHDIAVNGSAVNVCSTDEFSSSTTGGENKLGSRQFLKFAVAADGMHTVSVSATAVPAGERADPDFVLHRAGPFDDSTGSPDDDLDCTAATPLGCDETATFSMPAGDWVLEVFEWTNTQPEDGEFPPIGRTCFDVRITQ